MYVERFEVQYNLITRTLVNLQQSKYHIPEALTYIKNYFDTIEDLPIGIDLKKLNNQDQTLMCVERFEVIYLPERKRNFHTFAYNQF